MLKNQLKNRLKPEIYGLDAAQSRLFALWEIIFLGDGLIQLLHQNMKTEFLAFGGVKTSSRRHGLLEFTIFL